MNQDYDKKEAGIESKSKIWAENVAILTNLNRCADEKGACEIRNLFNLSSILKFYGYHKTSPARALSFTFPQGSLRWMRNQLSLAKTGDAGSESGMT